MASCFMTPTLRDGEDFAWKWARHPNPLCLFKDCSCLVPQAGLKSPENTGKTHMVNPCSFSSITTSYFLSQKVVFGIPHSIFNGKCKKHWALLFKIKCPWLLFPTIQTHTTFSLPCVTSSCTFPRVNIWGIEMFYGWAEEGIKGKAI